MPLSDRTVAGAAGFKAPLHETALKAETGTALE